ncbi:MAG TPA: alpha-2-macroglobulin family protein [Kofleriaceae bacterium]|jgi:hypothetical protein
MKRLVLVGGVLLAACGSKTDTGGGGGGSAQGSALELSDKGSNAPDGLEMRVSEGKQGAPAFDRAKLAPAKDLSAADVSALLARTKQIASEAGDQKSFALRANSQPPPRTGTTVTSTFPAPPSSLLPPSPTDANKALTVLRHMPDGQVAIAPELSITFSQAMVAVTSQEDAAKTVPATLSPTAKGKWRWLGTRTLLFDPDVRFPMATTYTVEVPAGTKSATGQAMAAATKFSFETPTPSIVQSYPSFGSQRRDVHMFVMFDQKIDRVAMFQKLHATSGGGFADGKPIQLTMLDDKEIKADKTISAFVDAAKGEQDSRWIAFRPTALMPADAQITVTVDKGAPSAEGPNVTKEPQSFGFSTYPPLKIVESRCGYDNRCPPGMPYSVHFNNPIDVDAFDPASITVSPKPDGLSPVVNGEWMSIEAGTDARTTYKITLPANLRDAFGQTLGSSADLTWTVGDAIPTFYGPNGMVVLDPLAKKPTLDFFSTNYDQLKVRLYQVTPADYDAWGAHVMDRDGKHPGPPGKKVVDAMINTTPGPNKLVETHIDLAPALTNGVGHVIAIVEPSPWHEKYDPPRMEAWVQATKLGLQAHIDNEQLVAFASDLATGAPAKDVSVTMFPANTSAATVDASGLATLPLPPSIGHGANYLVVKKGNDTAFVAEENGWWQDVGSWVKHAEPSPVTWYVVDDRHLYKPGEEVSMKGWLRKVDFGKNGDVGLIGDDIKQVSYTVSDSQGNQIATGSSKVNALGGFDTKFTLPSTPNLGYAQIRFVAPGGDYYHQIQVEEFRRPEFEVSAQAGPGPFVIGGGGDVTVSAKYYSGGPLAGADATWSVSATPTTFTPPNRDDYSFGTWTPWWGGREEMYEGDFEGYRPSDGPPANSWSLAGKTDATGAHTLHMDFLGAKPSVPMSVTTYTSVMDVNRQAWNATASLLVHPAADYVGLKAKRPFVAKGTPYELELVGVDIDGKIATGAKIDVRTVRLDSKWEKGRYINVELDPQTCTAVAAEAPSQCKFGTQVGGEYKVTATIIDAQGRKNVSTIDYWVEGGETHGSREVAMERVQIIPDKKEYAAGNIAELLVLAPFYPAEGVVTWRRSGIVKTERITLTGPSTVINVPITDMLVPNIYVQVDLVGAAARLNDKNEPDATLPKRPAYASGVINLPIPPKQRTLAVTATPAAAKLSPGESTKVSIEVKDATGAPVPDAEAVVMVVDESVLSLAGYSFPDPINSFYPQRSAGTRDQYSRAYVKLAKPERASLNGAPGDATGGEGGAMGSGSMGWQRNENAEMPAVTAAEPMKLALPRKPKVVTKGDKLDEKEIDEDGVIDQTIKKPAPDATKAIAIRTNFNPLAAFSPSVKTDATGKATVDVKLPDNLTRYRIVAIAVAGGKQFGKGENTLTARLPLMVRPSPPRFLNFGDVFELPVVVQNQTDAPMTVKVAVRVTNASLTAGAGREVTVPANDRVEVRFPAAAQMAGTARFQFVGAAGTASDAAEVALPVWTPATTEAFATYGVIDEGTIAQPVALPDKVVTEFGGLEVSTASTNLQALTDAFLYLVRYPYECAEQRSSRILSIAALRDVLAAFHSTDLPSADALAASVAQDIDRIGKMQNGDGGFAYWDNLHPSEPYLSVYVANALGHAKAKGYAVPEETITHAKEYLRVIEQHYPAWYDIQIRTAISAYALYTRKQLGDLDIQKAKDLFAHAGGTKIDIEAQGWLLGTMAGNANAKSEREQIMTFVTNHVSETAGAANFTTGYGDGAYLILSSDRRVDAVMLESLIQEAPTSDLIPKVVTGLLGHRKAGRWLNTQENTFALLALDLYFQTYEKTTPNFVARVWLGNDYAGDHAFKGRTTETAQIDIAMKDVETHDKQALTIQKDGAGRLYYRIGMTYAPASLKLDAADYGFVVTRSYEGVDDPKDVTRDAQGIWHIKSGARVRIQLAMVNENVRYHVALVDPMPAGLEAINPALGVQQPTPPDAKPGDTNARNDWWYGPWYEHQNLRDERTEAFTQYLYSGVHHYDYMARATTPGTFVVPPTKAEEMYMPETFGRSASDRVVVE